MKQPRGAIMEILVENQELTFLSKRLEIIEVESRQLHLPKVSAALRLAIEVSRSEKIGLDKQSGEIPRSDHC